MSTINGRSPKKQSDVEETDRRETLTDMGKVIVNPRSAIWAFIMCRDSGISYRTVLTLPPVTSRPIVVPHFFISASGLNTRFPAC